MAGPPNDVLLDELKDIKVKIQDMDFVHLESCHKELVQMKIRHTEYKEITVKMQFPDDYPNSLLIIEIKSKNICTKMIKGLENICEQELRKEIGRPQIITTVKFLSDFILNNPFIVCSEELNYIKKDIFRDGDELKIKQKAGVIIYKAVEGRYYIEVKVTVPFQYPSHHVDLDIKDTNLPGELFQNVKGQSKEILRKCVEQPIRRKESDPIFKPQPSLRRVMEYLVIDCIRRLPTENCHVCKETALPTNPKDVEIDEQNPFYVYRVYCGHLYHYKCLDSYMKTPPFGGGKKCLECGQRIFHDKWNIPPRLAEDRWAHQEAKKREIAEVAEFLGFD